MKRAYYLRTDLQGKLQLYPCRRRPVPGHTFTGDIRVHQLTSRVLGETMPIWVYLPPGFAPGDPWRYPCLYLHDGQNVFDARSAAFGQEWGVDEAAERLIQEGRIEPIIMVAVANTPARIAHYTPFPDPRLGGGQGPLYRRFLIEELKPWLEELYPLRRDARSTAIAGSSLGGLSSLYLGWTRPDVFGLVAALSPSLWWGERKLITRIAGDPPCERRPHKIWVDMGTDESDQDDNHNQVPDVLDDLRTLRAVLLAHGYREGQDFHYGEVCHGRHDEAAWGQRFAEVLCWLFPPLKS